MQVPGDPRLLVDASTRDDAAVLRLDADRALIATVDFFTPIVDDAATWGAIAAANALSDVYAMGGRPFFALNLVCWPRDQLPFDLLGEVLQGAADVARRAGCLVVGGHSIDDREPKFGMAVIGEAHPDRLLTNAAARPGDALVLTKPLGTGILTTALKRDLATEADLAEAVRSMTTLNDTAAAVARRHQLVAATDITGFGLIGHLASMLTASGVSAAVGIDALPLLAGARELARAGCVPGGTMRNLASVEGVVFDEAVPEEDRLLAADAQTSGGLLLAVPPSRLDAVLADLAAEGTLAQAVIGCVTDGAPGTLRVSAALR